MAVALVLGCRDADERSSRDAAVPAAALIARVDGSGIDAAELPPSGDLRRDRRALDALIARLLAAREAERRGLDESAPTRDQLAAIRRDAAAREEEALRDALFAQLRDDVIVEEEALRAHYEKTRARYTERRIALRRERFATEAASRARDAQLGATERLDPATSEVLVPATAERLPDDVLPEALRLQRPGERAVAVREGGASLIELVAIEPAAPRSFEDARSEVEKSLRTLRAQEAFRAEIERLRAAATVEIDEAALRARSAAAR